MNLNINICGSSPQKNIGEYHLVNELKNIPQKKKTNKQISKETEYLKRRKKKTKKNKKNNINRIKQTNPRAAR